MVQDEGSDTMKVELVSLECYVVLMCQYIQESVTVNQGFPFELLLSI